MNVWQELRRRRVFRVAGLYVVGAWLVIQVADISFPAWGLPETALRYLFIAAAAGFPIALIFGWFYDIKPQGIVRTKPAAHAELVDLSLKRADYVILVALVAVGIAILLGSLGGIREEIESGPAVAGFERRDNSIAVLPFTNLDINPDTGYFSDGVTEEILHRLSTLGALHVLASTSSFAFRGSDLSPADISGRLGVRYLLQGSVRRDADYVRVTARLLDETGFQLWSDSFDRKLEGIFTIQTEIAVAVSRHIVSEIVPLQALPAGRTTENMDAYNEYLLGKAFLDGRASGWREKATAAFRRAIELDPRFAPPHAGLAVASTVMTGGGPQWEEGRALAETAVGLDPDFAFGHAALGLLQFALREREAGLLSLRRSIELDPSLAVSYGWLAWALQRSGQSAEAEAAEHRGLEIDPLNPILVTNVSEREALNGNFERAEALLLRLTQLPKPTEASFENLSFLYDFWDRYERALAIARQDVRHNRDNPFGFWGLALSYASLGMFDDADYWHGQFRSRLPATTIPDVGPSYEYSRRRGQQSILADELGQVEAILDSQGDQDAMKLGWRGLAHIRLGNHARGIAALEQSLDIWQQGLSPEDPAGIEGVMASWFRQWNPPLYAYAYAANFCNQLAFAYREVGREDDAARVLQALGEVYAPGSEPYLPVTIASTLLIEGKALQRALSGDTVGALETLQQAVDHGWAGYYRVINDPAWAATIGRPEFKAVLAEAKAELDRQRAIVESADAEHDFRAEVEALVAR